MVLCVYSVPTQFYYENEGGRKSETIKRVQCDGACLIYLVLMRHEFGATAACVYYLFSVYKQNYGEK